MLNAKFLAIAHVTQSILQTDGSFHSVSKVVFAWGKSKKAADAELKEFVGGSGTDQVVHQNDVMPVSAFDAVVAIEFLMLPDFPFDVQEPNQFNF
jgi:predicted ester cyclase